MTERSQSPAYCILRASTKRLLAYIEQEVERAGGCAKIYDDQLCVVGSRRVIPPGLRELVALGFVTRTRGIKCSEFELSNGWRTITTRKEAMIVSEVARLQHTPTKTPAKSASVSA